MRFLWFHRREARPDAEHWPGRRGWAVIDAVLWPALGIAIVLRWLSSGRLVGAVVVAICLLAAMRRVCRAVRANHRYHFTTSRWGRVLLAWALFGWLLRWLLRG